MDTVERTQVPQLSIVIPAHNVAPYVQQAVESALTQTLRDIEVVVVDDGSTDATPQVLERVAAAQDDPRLRIVTQANGGLSAARNTGIREARGSLIGFLDADDLWLPEKAAAHVAIMHRDSSIGITFSNSEYLTEEGRRTGSFLLAGRIRPSLHDMIRRNHIGNGSTPIVRRECFEAAGDFSTDLRSCEDYEMWCRILCFTSYRAELVPQPLTLYRLRSSSLSFNFAGFLRNADSAIAHLRSAMPNVPPRVLRAGHAEHYRIAAWKAASTGHTLQAFHLLCRALQLRPALLLFDWRAVGTAVALMVPSEARGRFVRFAKSLLRRRSRVARPAGTGVGEHGGIVAADRSRIPIPISFARPS